jgi:hypothetical protein
LIGELRALLAWAKRRKAARLQADRSLETVASLVGALARRARAQQVADDLEAEADVHAYYT